jgi:hypothetical protein
VILGVLHWCQHPMCVDASSDPGIWRQLRTPAAVPSAIEAAVASTASGAIFLLALGVASAGAVSAAGALLALGLGLYARHWLSLAKRSRVGAHSEDEVRRSGELGMGGFFGRRERFE